MSMRKPAPTGGLVYSTEGGRMCPACRIPIARCTCRGAATAPAADGIVRVSRQSKGRGGKTVTVVTGVPGDGTAIAALGKALRTLCGSGGTVKDGVIEIQGDHRDRVLAHLVATGLRAKAAGG